MGWGIIVLWIGVGFVTERNATALRWFQFAHLELSYDWEVRMEELSDRERRYFTSKRGTEVGKWSFRGEESGLSGTVVVVESSELNGIHPPEMCYIAHGLYVESTEEWEIEGLPLRCMRLRDGRTALYWLQSREEVTLDFLSCLRSQILGRTGQWVMVSFLIDEEVDRSDEHLMDLVAVSHSLRKMGNRQIPVRK